jgi:ribosomal protein S15P/S13E
MAKKVTSKNISTQSIHPWRLCAPGRHWVREHSLHIPPSKKNPGGSTTIRHAHCADNPSKKDQLYPDEIQEMAQQNFSKIKEKPCPIGLEFKEKGNQYDDLIAGWTKYWNDVLKPDIPLDPNVVKALIATESGFNPKILANKKDKNSARGLMQVTNESRRILGNEKGELKNHYLILTRENLNDPCNNICAGIRWLFRKREIASSLLKRTASWEEAIYEFKGGRTTSKEQPQKLMNEFNKAFKELSKCGKS